MQRFSFPYEPYPIQLSLMETMYRAIDQKKVAILESPTGTGKSLSTICASLTWLEDFQRKRDEEIKRCMCEVENANKEADNDDDWINAHRKKLQSRENLSAMEAEIEAKNKVDERLKKARDHKRNKSAFPRKRNMPSGEDLENDFPTDDVFQDRKEDDEFIPVEEYNSDDEAEAKEKSALQCTKIIYASRTHSQLEQFVAEISKTRFQPRVVTAGSRRLLCVNEDVLNLKHPNLINDRCNELREAKKKNSAAEKRLKDADGAKVARKNAKNCTCDFAKTEAIEDLADQILTVSVSTPEELTKAGKSLKACPYFASRGAMPICELVLVPYNVLLHKSTREAWALDLKDNVVIVDEAHNLLQTVAGIHTVSMSRFELTVACELLANYLDRYGSRLKPKNLRYVRQLKTVVAEMTRLIGAKVDSGSDLVLTLPRFIAELGCPEVDFFKLLSFMESVDLCKKLHGFYLRLRADVNAASVTADVQPQSGMSKVLQAFKARSKQADAKDAKKQTSDLSALQEYWRSKEGQVTSPMYAVKQFLEAITSKTEDATILIEQGSDNRFNSKYRFLLLNPAEKLRDVVKESRSLVLIGGTMKPLDQLMDAFQRVCGVSGSDIVQYSCGHVIDEFQLTAVTVSRAPNGQVLNLVHENRGRPEVIAAIAQTFVNLLRHVPNGAVAFFPSYDYLDLFVKRIRASKAYDAIEKIKPIVVESRQADVWPVFCRQAPTDKGAFLLAVVGGKLSEGINFGDELGRCVFMIGLPYANSKSLDLKERMRYLDEKVGQGAGARFYSSLCFQSVNQAIGRVIRHRHDYAAIVLLDSRYAQPAIVDALPSWVASSLKHTDNFAQTMSTVISFFRNAKTRVAESRKEK